MAIALSPWESMFSEILMKSSSPLTSLREYAPSGVPDVLIIHRMTTHPGENCLLPDLAILYLKALNLFIVTEIVFNEFLVVRL